MGAIKVRELNKYIKKYMAMDYILSDIEVEGEISNVVNHRNGNVYFSLKDDYARINCICYYMDAQNITYMPTNGQNIIVKGSVSIFERDGSINIYVRDIKLVGMGDLHERYLVLKDILYKEGLFEEKNKKKLPYFPKKVGVVTSSTGAAIRDIINVLKRRNSSVDLILYPSLVQGDGAVDNIIAGLDYFENSDVDVVIVGRGGGSLEDLFAFNSEKLARKIYSMNKPVISAVGHEIDYVISDFVSDLRAPTPSAAAELVSMSKADLNNSLFLMVSRLNSISEKLILDNRANINSFESKLVDNLKLKIDDEIKNLSYLNLKLKVLRPDISYKRNSLKHDIKNLNRAFYSNVKDKRRDLDARYNKLSSFNKLDKKRSEIESLFLRFKYINIKNNLSKKNDALLSSYDSLKKSTESVLNNNSAILNGMYAELFKDVDRKIGIKSDSLKILKNELDFAIKKKVSKESLKLMDLNRLFKRPKFVSEVLIRNSSSNLVTSVKDLNNGDNFNLEFKDGSVYARVEKIVLRGELNEWELRKCI